MARTYSFEEISSEIPGQDVKAPAPTAPEESGFGRMMRKAGEAATAVGPIGLAAGGALRLAGRAPQAVQAMAGPVERGARGLAQMLTPTTGRGLAAATGSAGLAGATGEAARQAAQAGGAGPSGQQLAEFTGALTPSAARAATARAAAPIVEAAGKKLYTPPPDLATPEKARMQQTLSEAGVRLLPSEIKESKPLKAIERVFQLVPGSRQEFAKFGKENQTAANLAVAKAFGGTEPSLAPQAMKDARNSLSQGYENLLQDKTFKVSGKVKDELQAALNQNEQLRELAVGKPKVSEFAQALQQNQFNGVLWKDVRSEVAAYVAGLEGPSKMVGLRVLKQFDDIAKNNLTKQEHDVLMGLDRKYAALSSFEDAFRRNPAILRAGDVDLNKFAQQYAAVEPMNVLYGRTGGRGGEYVPLTEAAQTYRTFTTPRIPETQATTLGGLGRAAMGLSLYGGGFGSLPFYPGVGASLLAIPPVSRAASKAYLQPEKTAEALRQAGITPFATYPMLTPSKEQK